jgi:RimJ/RimL family protein N-acetyltransferase
MNYVFKRCPNIKVDTGEDNTGVQRLLERNNFKYCGRLKDPESKERVTWLAYQKIQ